jgi:hypothetical protein
LSPAPHIGRFGDVFEKGGNCLEAAFAFGRQHDFRRQTEYHRGILRERVPADSPRQVLQEAPPLHDEYSRDAQPLQKRAAGSMAE